MLKMLRSGSKVLLDHPSIDTATRSNNGRTTIRDAAGHGDCQNLQILQSTRLEVPDFFQKDDRGINGAGLASWSRLENTAWATKLCVVPQANPSKRLDTFKAVLLPAVCQKFETEISKIQNFQDLPREIFLCVADTTLRIQFNLNKEWAQVVRNTATQEYPTIMAMLSVIYRGFGLLRQDEEGHEIWHDAREYQGSSPRHPFYIKKTGKAEGYDFFVLRPADWWFFEL